MYVHIYEGLNGVWKKFLLSFPTPFGFSSSVNRKYVCLGVCVWNRRGELLAGASQA